MHDTRTKVRICLITVILLAVITGILYYLYAVRDHSTVTEGTLVTKQFNEAVIPWQ